MGNEQWSIEQKRQFKQEETERRGQIEALCATHNMPDLARQAVNDDWDIARVRRAILDNFRPEPLITAEVGLTDKEVKRFSFLNAITAMMTPGGSRAQLAPFELDVSNAVAKKMGREARGFFVPHEVLTFREEMTRAQQRDQLVGSATGGGNTVATNLLAGSFIDVLRNRALCYLLGATRLGGLVGNVAIPRKSGASAAQWVLENAAPNEASIGFDQVTLTPRSVTNFIDYSRKMVLQGTPDIENIVRMDLASGVSVEIDRAALHGASSSNQPLGICNTPGIGSVAGGTNGASPTYAHMVALESAVATANGDSGRQGYLVNARSRGMLKTTQRFTSTDSPIWTSDRALAAANMGFINGQLAGCTNQVSAALTKGSASGNIPVSAIIFGNWADLLIAEWGAIDLLVDPYTGSSAGTTRVRIFMDVDIAVRHAASFAAMLDALG